MSRLSYVVSRHNWEDWAKRGRKLGLTSPYHRKVETEKKVRNYTSDVMRIGKKTYDVLPMRPVRVPPSELTIGITNTWRALVLGSTGSGKSFLMRSIIDRFYKCGGIPIIMTDVKNEYYTSNNPVQPNFRNNLGLYEEPSGMPVRVYYPAYLYKRSKIEGQEIIQIRLGEVSPEELLTCIGSELTSPQKDLFSKCLYEEQELKYPTLKGLIDRISDSSHFEGTKKSLITKLENLEKTEVIGDKYPTLDLIDDIVNRRVPVLNLLGYEGYSEITRFYVGFFLRKFMLAKSIGEIPKSIKVLVVLDELPDFCPKNLSKNEVMVSKDEIEGMIRKSRHFNIFMISATQEIDRVSEEIIKQSNIIFMPNPKRAILEDFRKMCYNKIRKDISPNSMTHIVGRIFNSRVAKEHKDGKRDWYYANIDKNQFFVCTPYSPLSMHCEQFGLKEYDF